jgi:hypothetical protein
MFMHEQIILVIAYMGFSNHDQSLHCCDLQFSGTSSQIFHLIIHKIPFGGGGSFDEDSSF